MRDNLTDGMSIGMLDRFNDRWTMIGDEPDDMSDDEIDRVNDEIDAIETNPMTIMIDGCEDQIDLPIDVMRSPTLTVVRWYDGTYVNTHWTRDVVSDDEIAIEFRFLMHYGTTHDDLDALA